MGNDDIAHPRRPRRLDDDIVLTTSCLSAERHAVYTKWQRQADVHLNRVSVVAVPSQNTSVHVARDELVFGVHSLGHALERSRSCPAVGMSDAGASRTGFRH